MPVSRTTSFGFTLIELAIVLVIIGLLLGAVVGGRAMIRNAELQSVVSDYTRYNEAAATFKKQYQSIPGDMVDAEDFWGRSTACGGTSDTGVCNGDGNGLLDLNGGKLESFQFWRQLVLAGRITGNYTGEAGAANTHNTVIGENVPASRISGAGWDAVSAPCATSFSITQPDYGNGFYFGGEDTVTNRCLGRSGDNPLTPEEAWKLDTKLDDGKPGRGTIMSSDPDTGCATATIASDYDAPYNLSEKSPQCGLHFIQQY